MPKLSEHHSSSFAKIMYIGDSSTGKTGSLTSLVAAGYKLRIIDLDNGLDPLVAFVRKECPDKIGNVEFESLRDNYKATMQGPIISGSPKAFTAALALMTKWSDGTAPCDWGDKTILVIDSFTALGRAALAWAEGMNPTAKDKRNWFFMAQQKLEVTLAMLTSESFKANVIIISHVKYEEDGQGLAKGYISAVGSALGPIIPSYFNTIVLAQSQGNGKNVKRTITTIPTAMIDLKNSAPFKIDQTLPLETGLATLFEKLKETV